MTSIAMKLSMVDERQILGVAAGLAALSVVIVGGLAAARLHAASERPALSRNRVAIAPLTQADLTPAIALAPFGSTVGDETSGALILRGLIQGPPGVAAALIAEREGPARPYGLGEQIGQDARLEEIGVDYAVLRTDAGPVRLTFPKARPSKDDGALANSPAQTATAFLTAQNPAASAEPGLVQANGFKLGSTPWPELQRAGIAPGDVVATVDGLPVGEMERGVVDAIASGKARIEVVRDGRTVVLGKEGR
jgi:hypothetical protein